MDRVSPSTLFLLLGQQVDSLSGPSPGGKKKKRGGMVMEGEDRVEGRQGEWRVAVWGGMEKLELSRRRK